MLQLVLIFISFLFGLILALDFMLDVTSRGVLFGIGFLLSGGFGIVLTPQIISTWGSPLYTVATIVISLFSVFYGYLLVNTDKDLRSYWYLSTVTFITGFVYFSSVLIKPIRKFLIEIVANHVYIILSSWYAVELSTGPIYGYMSELTFVSVDPTLITYIDIACTGIGSIALVYGIISVFDSTLTKKFIGYIVSFFIIYILNIARNVFIAVAFIEQWFSYGSVSNILFSSPNNSELTSFIIAETVISQSISALLLFIGIFIVLEYTLLLDAFFDSLENDIRVVSSTIQSVWEELNQ